MNQYDRLDGDLKEQLIRGGIVRELKLSTKLHLEQDVALEKVRKVLKQQQRALREPYVYVQLARRDWWTANANQLGKRTLSIFASLTQGKRRTPEDSIESILRKVPENGTFRRCMPIIAYA